MYGSNSKLAVPAGRNTHAVHKLQLQPTSSATNRDLPPSNHPSWPDYDDHCYGTTTHRSGPGQAQAASALFFFLTRTGAQTCSAWCGTGVVEQKLTRTDMHMRSRDGGAGTCEQGARPAGGGGDGGGHRRARGLAVAEVRVHVPCTLARRHIPTSRPRRDVRQTARAAGCGAASICVTALWRIARPGLGSFCPSSSSQNLCLCGNSGQIMF